MKYCSVCRKENDDDIEMCEECNSLSFQQNLPNGITAGDTFNYNISEKWAWTLGFLPLLIFLIDIVLETFQQGASESALGSAIALGISTSIFFLDKNELEKYFKPGKWVWLGLFLTPVYLFIRANKTTKKYGYAIMWCITFVIYIVLSTGTGSELLSTTGKLTINNIPEEFEGKYVKATGHSGTLTKNFGLYFAYADFDKNYNITGGIVNNGSVTLKVWYYSKDKNGQLTALTGYKGSNNVTFNLYFYNSASMNENDLFANRDRIKVPFKMGVGSINF